MKVIKSHKLKSGSVVELVETSWITDGRRKSRWYVHVGSVSWMPTTDYERAKANFKAMVERLDPR